MLLVTRQLNTLHRQRSGRGCGLKKPSVETTVLYLNAHKAAVIVEQCAILGGIW